MNVPQLRFDGFDGEWKQQELSKLLEFKNGINADKDSYGYGTKFINVLDILNNDCILSENIIGSVNATAQQLQTYSVTHGDILFLRSSETREDVGKCNVYLDEEKPSVFGGFVIRGKKIANYSPFFLKTALNNSSARNQISSKAGGSTRYNVGQGILSEVTVNLPRIEEQQKISSFLILLNQKIEKQREKIEKLEQFKKGMMQKIFLQELRFRNEDGKEFPDWKPTTFHEVADIRRGASPRPIADPKWFSATSKIGWLRISDVTASGVYLKKVTQYLSEEGIKKSVLLEKPHLILSIAATIGKPVINKIPLCIHDGFIVFKNLKLDMLFGYYYLVHFQDKWSQFRQPGSQFNLNSDLVGNLNIMIPSNGEQEAIAKFFSVIDKKIERETEKLMAQKEQKKGFMQGIFV